MMVPIVDAVLARLKNADGVIHKSQVASVKRELQEEISTDGTGEDGCCCHKQDVVYCTVGRLAGLRCTVWSA